MVFTVLALLFPRFKPLLCRQHQVRLHPTRILFLCMSLFSSWL